MPDTRHSLHRSQRARLMHWAPASGSGGEAMQGVVMEDANRWGEASPEAIDDRSNKFRYR